jgi:hypothetical protein
MNAHYPIDEWLRLAETIRAACITTALEGYEDASIHGLCHEGAWECAIDAMRVLDLQALLAQPSDEHGR